MPKMERTQIAGLVRAARAGDGEAMSQLLQAARKNVLFQCRRILKHPEDAEDLTQEVLLIIYEKLGDLKEPEHFISWANSIATHRCLNFRARNPKDLQFAKDEQGHSVLDTLAEMDRQAIPDQALDNAETVRMVRELVDSLPETQRITILSHYNADISVKEIAAEMGVSENTVKSRLLYGRKAIEKGVKEYEKQGIKLYGLSPLPFLLYFLRAAAETETSDEAAAAAVAAILSGSAGTSAAGAAASGTAGAAAETAASSSVGASAAGTAASGAAGTAASTTGVLGGLGAKVAAIVLAGAVAVGGGAAIYSSRQAQPPAQSANPGQIQQPADTADPDGPVPLAAYTDRLTTVAGTPDAGLRGIYLRTPVFEEVNEGYRNINAYLDQLHQAFNPEDDPKVAAMLGIYESGADQAQYTRSLTVTYQDEYYVCLTSYESAWAQELNLPSYRADTPTDPYFQELRAYFLEPARINYTFDVRTGALLELSDLHPGTDEEVAEWVADIIRASRFSDSLNEDTYPDADDGFLLASHDLTTEDINIDREYGSSYDAGPYQQGQAIYIWEIDPTIDPLCIPLPAWPERP